MIPAVSRGAGPSPIYLNRDGTVQQVDANDQAVDFVRIDENAFKTGEWSSVDSNFRADVQIRPGLSFESRMDNCANRHNLPIFNRYRGSARTYDINRPGSRQNG